jgi:hypothetical protein
MDFLRNCFGSNNFPFSKSNSVVCFPVQLAFFKPVTDNFNSGKILKAPSNSGRSLNRETDRAKENINTISGLIRAQESKQAELELLIKMRSEKIEASELYL